MYQLKKTQFIPVDMEQCWKFFSSPENLKLITPSYMGFEIKTQLPEKMYEGLMISYTVRPVFGIPISWITEIKTVVENQFFVDEQRKGPYSIWHHEHHFKAKNGGTEMIDVVSYTLPFGLIGKILHRLFVRKKLEEIFDYRFKKVEEIFNSKEG